MLGINYSIQVFVDDSLSAKKKNVIKTILNELVEDHKSYTITSGMMQTILEQYTQGNDFPVDTIPISSIMINLDRFFHNKPVILYKHASIFLQQQFYFYIHFPAQYLDKYITFGDFITLFEKPQELYDFVNSSYKALCIGKLGRNLVATVDFDHPFSYVIHKSMFDRGSLRFDKKPLHRCFYDVILEKEVSDEPSLLTSTPF